MIVECPYCESRVDAKLIAQKQYPADDYQPSYRVSFLECPACNTALLAEQEEFLGYEHELLWTAPERLWPQPRRQFHPSVPKLAKKSLEEAWLCFGAKAYAACAVMCGRAIEAVCNAHHTKGKSLASGLKDLRDRKIIDQRLLEWGDALREQRNIGAHATEHEISRDDARDVLDFAIAICEYVFVLSHKYAAFQERQKKKQIAKSHPKKPPIAPSPGDQVA